MLIFQIKQRKHEFAFGSAVGASMFLVNETFSGPAYQNVFYDNFEWGVVEKALNWKMMQPLAVCMKIYGYRETSLSDTLV